MICLSSLPFLAFSHAIENVGMSGFSLISNVFTPKGREKQFQVITRYTSAKLELERSTERA